MITVKAKLKSASPYGQSRYHNTEKLEKESAADYEKRTWKNRCHTDDKGMVFIPPSAFKNCLSEAAKYLSIQIPGKGKATYTKHFEAGVMVSEIVPLGIHIDKMQPLWLFVPADGKRGGSKRVEKCFPITQQWEATVTFYVFDETITKDVFRYVLEQAGKFIGIGFSRPRNNGFFGRFEVVEMSWNKS